MGRESKAIKPRKCSQCHKTLHATAAEMKWHAEVSCSNK